MHPNIICLSSSAKHLEKEKRRGGRRKKKKRRRRRRRKKKIRVVKIKRRKQALVSPSEYEPPQDR